MKKAQSALEQKDFPKNPQEAAKRAGDTLDPLCVLHRKLVAILPTTELGRERYLRGKLKRELFTLRYFIFLAASTYDWRKEVVLCKKHWCKQKEIVLQLIEEVLDADREKVT